MNNVQDAFKHNRARKNVIAGGAAILVCITVLSCVSSFVIYRGGFTDVPHPFDKMLALFAVIVVEGAFVWLVYGFTRAFSSAMERFISVCGMIFLLGVMLMNLVTHFMMVKGIELDSFQHAWVQWGAVMVFIAVLLLVLFITLADPMIRLIRLELRYLGAQEEKILEAKTEGLESDQIREAMAARAEQEAALLATRIIRESRSLPAYGAVASHRSRVGFQTGAAGDDEEDYTGPKGRRR
jgi:hypothetical protein